MSNSTCCIVTACHVGIWRVFTIYNHNDLYERSNSISISIRSVLLLLTYRVSALVAIKS